MERYAEEEAIGGYLELELPEERAWLLPSAVSYQAARKAFHALLRWGRPRRVWLQLHELAIEEVRNAIMLMALIAAFRWVASLYRGIITGFQQLVWLSGFNALVTTFRFLLVIPVLQTIGATPIVFFSLMMSTRTVDTNLYQIAK